MKLEYIRNAKYYFFSDKELYRNVVKLAVPVMVQNLLAALLNMIDTVMVGKLGETAISAVGQANQVFFVMNLFLFGTGCGVSIFVAQLWGGRDQDTIHKVIGIGMVSGIGITALFTGVALLAPEFLFTIFTTDAAVQELGGEYLFIVCFSYVITAVTTIYAAALRSVGEVRLPMAASACGIAVNTVFNWILIFGKFGFPALGVRGAAIATVMARVVECLIVVVTIYRRRSPAAAPLRGMLSFTRPFCAKFFRTALPVMFNEGLWSLGTTVYSIVYGRMGTDIYSASVIGSTVEKLAWILIMAMGSACAVVIGNEIGAGREERAFKCGVRFCVLSVAVAAVMGTILFATSSLMVRLFEVTPEVRAMGMAYIRVYACTILFKTFNFAAVVGTFRSGGDTKFCLLLDTLGMWLIGVPMSLIFGLWLRLPIHLVVLLVQCDEYIKFFICMHRLGSRKWIRNLTHIAETAPAEPALEAENA